MKNNSTAPATAFWGFSGYLQVLPPEPKRETTHTPTPQPQHVPECPKLNTAR
jgi:hypothetical protein